MFNMRSSMLSPRMYEVASFGVVIDARFIAEANGHRSTDLQLHEIGHKYSRYPYVMTSLKVRERQPANLHASAAASAEYAMNATSALAQRHTRPAIITVDSCTKQRILSSPGCLTEGRV